MVKPLCLGTSYRLKREEFWNDRRLVSGVGTGVCQTLSFVHLNCDTPSSAGIVIQVLSDTIILIPYFVSCHEHEHDRDLHPPGTPLSLHASFPCGDQRS